MDATFPERGISTIQGPKDVLSGIRVDLNKSIRNGLSHIPYTFFLRRKVIVVMDSYPPWQLCNNISGPLESEKWDVVGQTFVQVWGDPATTACLYP